MADNLGDFAPALANQAQQQTVNVSGAVSVTGQKITVSATAPVSPADTDIWVAIVDSTSGIRWSFQYAAGSVSALKWECIGGTPIDVAVNDGATTDSSPETTASTVYTTLATAGPAVTLPFTGDYDITLEGAIEPGSSTSAEAFYSYDIGGTGASDADALRQFQPDAASPRGFPHAIRTKRKAGLSASTILTAKYRTTAGTAGFGVRVMRVMPVRVSG